VLCTQAAWAFLEPARIGGTHRFVFKTKERFAWGFLPTLLQPKPLPSQNPKPLSIMGRGLKVRANFMRDLSLSTVLENAGETTSWTGELFLSRASRWTQSAGAAVTATLPCGAALARVSALSVKFPVRCSVPCVAACASVAAAGFADKIDGDGGWHKMALHSGDRRTIPWMHTLFPARISGLLLRTLQAPAPSSASPCTCPFQ